MFTCISLVHRASGQLANQPPTLAPGDKFTVKPPGDEANYTTTVAHPPAQDPPPVAVKGNH